MAIDDKCCFAAEVGLSEKLDPLIDVSNAYKKLKIRVGAYFCVKIQQDKHQRL